MSDWGGIVMNRLRMDLTDKNRLLFRGEEADIVSWRGHTALRLNGLAVVPDLNLAEGSLEVFIGAEGAAYCGAAFRVRDSLNFELAYAQPHTSGGWDALQYDPVMNGVNTWQLYHGPGAQKAASIPTGDWFRFRIDFKDGWSRIQVNDEEPLYVPKLAHGHRDGFIGVWSYLPACFRDLSVSGRCEADDFAPPAGPNLPAGLVKDWFLDGLGKVSCDDNGIVNLNRCLPSTVTEARLRRRFGLERDADVTLRFGFSDLITIRLDGAVVCEERHTYRQSPEWHERGYVSLDRALAVPLAAGEHEIELELKRTEHFGYGFILALEGEGISLREVFQ